jgi:hypothetical protein
MRPKSTGFPAHVRLSVLLFREGRARARSQFRRERRRIAGALSFYRSDKAKPVTRDRPLLIPIGQRDLRIDTYKHIVMPQYAVASSRRNRRRA